MLESAAWPIPNSTFGASAAAPRWKCAIQDLECRGRRISFGSARDADGISGPPTRRRTAKSRNPLPNRPLRADQHRPSLMTPFGLDDDFELDEDLEDDEDDHDEDDVDRDDYEDEDDDPDDQDDQDETWQV